MRVTADSLKQGFGAAVRLFRAEDAAGKDRSWWLRVVGLYLVLILVLIKFVAIPLYGRVQAKEKVLAEYVFSVKALQVRLDKLQAARKPGMGVPERPRESLYAKEVMSYTIQAEVLEALRWAAARHGMAIQTFELQAPVPFKNVSEIPLLIRLTGSPKSALGFLEGLNGLRGKPAFTKEQFAAPLTVERLCQAIAGDGYVIQAKSADNTLERLNELLVLPNFYDIVTAKKKDMDFSKEVIDLAQKTAGFRRGRQFAGLSPSEQSDIRRLNRLLIEEVYAVESPKASLRKTVALRNLQLDFVKDGMSLLGTFVAYRREK